MGGFYPHAPKIFKLELYKGQYDIIDTRTGEIVETVRHLNDALRTVEMKNDCLR